MDKKNEKKPETKARKKLTISETALQKMVLEDEQLAHVVGGGPMPKNPTEPTAPAGG